ncbi:MAG: hypothetical protein AAGI14_00270 [Pseudomonadota bacterium]
MSVASFQSFMVIGLLCLIAAIVFMAFQVWRWIDLQKDSEDQSLAGIGHELRFNLNRVITEIGLVSRGEAGAQYDLLEISHPQLDALLSRPTRADRRTLSYIRGLYDELNARKLAIRAALAQAADTTRPIQATADTLINGLATLYLWEKQGGRPPPEARSTRSWSVRDWMKEHQFDTYAVPDMHLRDQVVERLRVSGMTLTPKPLTHTAHEYYSKRYDRKADPNAPFWKRKDKADEIETVADPAEEAIAAE